jgi:hypothetical protein
VVVVEKRMKTRLNRVTLDRSQMDRLVDNWLANLSRRGPLARGMILGLAVLGTYGLVAPVAGTLSGPAGLWTAAAAAGFCLAGAAAALLISPLSRRPGRALSGMLSAMAARMGIPLGFGLACHVQGGVLAQTGLLYYLLVFYPVTLAVETALSLPRDRQSASGNREATLRRPPSDE